MVKVLCHITSIHIQQKGPEVTGSLVWTMQDRISTGVDLVSKKSQWRTKWLRAWLFYSNKKKAILCLHCLILGPLKVTWHASIYAREGYADWLNVSRDIRVEIHETSAYHRKSDVSVICTMQKIQERIRRWLRYKIIYHNRTIASAVIDCISSLSRKNLLCVKLCVFHFIA